MHNVYDRIGATAIFAAIRRASPFVSSLAVEPAPKKKKDRPFQPVPPNACYSITP